MKLLFLCSQNKRRSLTAEKILNGVNGWNVRSAGTESNARNKVTIGHIGWADVIFTMEKKHTRRIQERFRGEMMDKKIVCLYISDDYEFMDRELIAMLKEQVLGYLDEIN